MRLRPHQLLSVVALLAAALVPLAAPSPAAAQSTACSFTVSEDGFNVKWDVDLKSEQYVVVQRRVFGKFWWRGRTTDDSMQDGLAPANAAAVDYRIVIKDKGKRVSSHKCELESVGDSTVECEATPVDDRYSVTISAPSAVGSAIVRRQVRDGGRFNWRARWDRTVNFFGTPGEPRGIVFDGASPTGAANYELWVRNFDGVIIGAAPCQTNEPLQCLTSVDDVELISQQPAPAPELIVEKFDLPPRSSFMGIDGWVYYVERRTGAGGSAWYLLNRLNPESGEIVQIERYEDYETPRINYLDSSGGVYLTLHGGFSHSDYESVAGGPPSGHFVANLADGRTVRDSAEGNVIDLYDPATGDHQQLGYLSGKVFASGADSDGRFIVRTPGGSAVVDLDCALRRS